MRWPGTEQELNQGEDVARKIVCIYEGMPDHVKLYALVMALSATLRTSCHDFTAAKFALIGFIHAVSVQMRLMFERASS